MLISHRHRHPGGLADGPDRLQRGQHAKWFGIAEPFHFGAPTFKFAAIASMCIVMLVTYTESTADMLAVGEMVDKDLSPNDLARGLATDGLSGLLAGFMNSFPDTAYAENVGLIEMTKVKSRWVVTVCGGPAAPHGRDPQDRRRSSPGCPVRSSVEPPRSCSRW